MGTEDKRREFEEIVTRLTTDYPSLARPAGRPLPRHVLIPVAVVAGVVWGLLSVAMVVWGARGVALTCTVVVLAGIAATVDSRRRRRF
jgi:hypothetical protein